MLVSSGIFQMFCVCKILGRVKSVLDNSTRCLWFCVCPQGNHTVCRFSFFGHPPMFVFDCSQIVNDDKNST